MQLHKIIISDKILTKRNLKTCCLRMFTFIHCHSMLTAAADDTDPVSLVINTEN